MAASKKFCPKHDCKRKTFSHTAILWTSAMKPLLPNAKLRPRFKDGVTVVGHYPDNLYEFHIHYRPPDWRCRCHVNKRVKLPSRGMSHFAPDDFVSYYRKDPLEFEGWNVACRWWNANRDKIMQAITLQSWELVKPAQSLIDVIVSGNTRYAIYSDSSQVWIDVYEQHSCGHWKRLNEKDLLVFESIGAAKEAVQH
jgi:hypothetical protein